MTSKKKIIVCTTSYLPFIGGAEIAIQEVSKRLCNEFDFIIITARQKRELAKRENVPEGMVIRLGFGNILDTWVFPFAGIYMIAKLICAREIPILWKRSSRNELLIWGMDISQGSVLGLFLKMIFPKIPFVCTVQYGYGDTRLQNARYGAIGIAFRRILKNTDAVTAISAYLMNTAVAYGFAGMGKIIPNGVDASLFEFQPWEAYEKKFKHDQRVVITTSRLVEKNGVDILVRAIAEIKKTIPSIKCHIIGDGPQRAPLEKLAKELNISRDIIFFGAIPYHDIPFYLQKADIFTRPSRFEGMGNSFVEALSVGLPIIGTPIGGIPDIIIEGKTGLFCNGDDSHDLAKKILALLHNQQLVSSLREEGRRMVEEKFSWHTIAKVYGELFAKLLDVRARILIATPLYPPEIGGPATYAHILAHNFLNEGIIARVLRFSDVRHIPKIARHISFFFRICARARGCDSLLALDPVSVGFPTALAAILTHKHFFIKIVGDYAWEQGTQRFGVIDVLDDFLKKTYGGSIELLRWIQRWSSRCARGIIVPSKYLKKIVVSWGIDAGKITVIANAHHVDVISESRENIRTSLALSGTVLVSAGRLVSWKGFDTLIECMPILLHSFPDAVLLIAGSGPEREDIESRIAAQKLQDHVKLLGSLFHTDLLTYMRASDAFVLASSYEGFSHTILEAMAMGTVVIVSNAGGNPELIQHGANGFLFALDDRKQIIQTIHEALSLVQDRKKSIQSSAITDASRYTTKRMVRETADYLLSL